MFCAFIGQSGERLQDHWSSGFHNIVKVLNFWTLKMFAVITLKFKQSGPSI